MDYSTHVDALNELFREVFPVVSTGSWTSEDRETIEELRNLVFRANRIVGKIRSEFDATVYKLNAAGTRPDWLEPIRAQRSEDSERPGRKAPSVDDVLDRLMK